MRNEGNVKEGYIEIALEGKHGKGNYTKVDSDDYLKYELWKYKWCMTPNGYVYAWNSEKKKNMRLHRLVLGLDDDNSLWGDHIRRDGEFALDNRKSNLRAVEPVENGRNRKPNKGQRYKGVSEHRMSGRIRAQLRLKSGHKFHIALFDDEVEAAYCVDQACMIEHGEHAYLNRVEDLLSEERKNEIKELVIGKLNKYYEKNKLVKPTHYHKFLLHERSHTITM